MNAGLFASELCFMIIAAVSLLLVYQFYISKNGMLRKLMIALFSIEFFRALIGGTYFILLDYKIEPIKLDGMRIMAVLPLAVVMLLIWRYLYKQNAQHYKNKNK